MITIDPSSDLAPFEQLRVQLVDAIASGELTPGQRLPTVRRLADDLGIAPGTVARAYRELESSHLIETRGRNGTFVSLDHDPATRDLQLAAQAFAAQASALRIDADVAIALVADALRARDAPA